LSRTLLDYVEKLVNEGQSYRGKVISLEALDRFGNTGAVKVHSLRAVTRDEVILPQPTLRLLEQNVINFIQQRDNLKKLGMASKKGLLLYGPPGAGKTHTIHYLASQLPGHTTLLVTAEQIGLLDHYFELARLLQPTMLVIEDVDLIVRTGEQKSGPCDESLLNKLLNEMDALEEDTATLFVLTTNRPEQLEATLASRPGLIDQAIEFPLPDEQGRQRLIRLYARSLKVSEELVNVIAQKINRASGAFIKELMRRAAQYFLQSGESGELRLHHVESALEEMLFRGGSLNLKLLGVAQETDPATNPFVIALPNR
jgi:ATP-dependent 26S proteasome regulatory subunit